MAWNSSLVCCAISLLQPPLPLPSTDAAVEGHLLPNQPAKHACACVLRRELVHFATPLIPACDLSGTVPNQNMSTLSCILSNR